MTAFTLTDASSPANQKTPMPMAPDLFRVFALVAASRGLLDRHALGEVARFIDVAAKFDCKMVGEQLQRDHA